MRPAIIFAVAALLVAPATGQGSRPPAYSTARSTIGTLLDDPRAKAVLVRHIPKIVGNRSFALARPMTLRGIQSYAGGDLSDAVLARIDADLARLGRAGGGRSPSPSPPPSR